MIQIEKAQANDNALEKLFSQFTVDLVSLKSNEILKDQEYLKTSGKISVLESKLKEQLSKEALEIYTEIEELQSYLCALYELHGFRQGFKLGSKIMAKLLAD